MQCARCGQIDVPDLLVPGSDRVEVLAWCCLLLPGLLYALWRHASRRRICAGCGSTQVLRVTRATRRQRREQDPSPPARQPQLRFAAPRLAWLAPPLARLRHAARGGALAGVAGVFALLSVDWVAVEPASVASAPQSSAGHQALPPKRAQRECERLCLEFHRANTTRHRECLARCVDGIDEDPLAAVTSGSSSAASALSGDTRAFGYHAPGERSAGSAAPGLGPDPRP
jgi:hypothetical protein